MPSETAVSVDAGSRAAGSSTAESPSDASSPSSRAGKWGDLTRLFKFAFVGGFNTVVTYVLYLVLLELGLHFNLALALEYVFGIVLGYVLNRVWTFSDRKTGTRAFHKYVVTYLAVFAINFALLNAIVRLGMGPGPAQAIALMAATLASYVLQKNWVFRDEAHA